MYITTDEAPAAFTQTLPNGSTVPVTVFDGGRSTIGPASLSTMEFLRATALTLAAYGQEDLISPAHLEEPVDESTVIRRWVRVDREPDGSLTIQWHVEGTWARVEADTPGAIEVVLIEF